MPANDIGQSQPNSGMLMGVPGASGQHPALRFNPGTVPGIARSGSARSTTGSDVMSPSANNGAGPSQVPTMNTRMQNTAGRGMSPREEYRRSMVQAQLQARRHVQAQIQQQQQAQMQNYSNPSNEWNPRCTFSDDWAKPSARMAAAVRPATTVAATVINELYAWGVHRQRWCTSGDEFCCSFELLGPELGTTVAVASIRTFAG